ncbi:GntR family transcriptional regulator [Sulfolobus tengchongensis]|uniref:GntR family transcriptional regulator n=1 Tax=Sulfolobus tengchongensis TaxID=207809 RepID=A0AAX4L3S5_9CREN
MTGNSNKRKSDLVYEKLKEDIQRGRYLPGQRLVEDVLAKEYNVRRNTIRVALSKLEKDGLVSKASNGTIVSFISVQEAIEVLEIRELLEGYVTRKAASRITEETIKKLEQILNEMKRVLQEGEYYKYSQLNEDFHNLIYEASESKIGQQLLKNLKMRIIRLQFQTILLPGRANDSIKEHEEILMALKNHDEDAAEKAARLHVANVKEVIKNNVKLLSLSESTLI